MTKDCSSSPLVASTKPTLAISRRTAVVLLGGLAVLVLGGALLLAKRLLPAGSTPPADQNGEAQLNHLHAACTSEMVANTCRVMGVGGVTLVGDSPPVFVAGVGAIAAKDYQAIYSAGDAMCAVVRESCAADWNSARCLTAQKIWLR